MRLRLSVIGCVLIMLVGALALDQHWANPHRIAAAATALCYVWSHVLGYWWPRQTEWVGGKAVSAPPERWAGQVQLGLLPVYVAMIVYFFIK